MKIMEIMTASPATCDPKTGLRDVAKMMNDNDCGEIPVVQDKRSLKPLGVVTDRDIACRSFGKGRNPSELTAGDVMTSPCVTVTAETSLEDCARVLERHHIRRVPVVDEDGRCVGIVSQADIALRADASLTAELLREISRVADMRGG
jgi:CBS domain-containing protein